MPRAALNAAVYQGTEYLNGKNDLTVALFKKIFQVHFHTQASEEFGNICGVNSLLKNQVQLMNK